MIRKPTADWGRVDEGAAVRTVRTATAVAKGGANVARRGGHAVRGLICYGFAALWGFAALDERPRREPAKPHRHRRDGGRHGLGRPPRLRKGARDVGLAKNSGKTRRSCGTACSSISTRSRRGTHGVIATRNSRMHPSPTPRISCISPHPLCRHQVQPFRDGWWRPLLRVIGVELVGYEGLHLSDFRHALLGRLRLSLRRR